MISSSEMLKRIEIARTKREGLVNCLGFAYYIIGIDDHEIFRDNPFDIDCEIFQVSSLKDASLIGYYGYKNDFFNGALIHLSVIHPVKRYTLIERNGVGAKVTERNRIFGTHFCLIPPWRYLGVK